MLTSTPVFMYWLLKPLGASHEQAYFACHLLLNLFGLWCLYYVLSRVMMPAGTRLIALGVLAVSGFAPYMGLNNGCSDISVPLHACCWGIARWCGRSRVRGAQCAGWA
jgi:hypothetical protein